MAVFDKLVAFQDWVQTEIASEIAGLRTKVTAFTASGTFTPDANCIHGYAVGKGGGGGGGSITVFTNLNYAEGGGGEGNTVIRFFRVADVSPTVSVTIGAGGAVATAGGDTTFGALLTAKGGGGSAFGYHGGSANTSGNVGDVVRYGCSGGAGIAIPIGTVVVGGSGGGSGGGIGLANGTAGTVTNGTAGLANSGGGGAGGASVQAGPGTLVGSGGGSGYLYVVEFLSA